MEEDREEEVIILTVDNIIQTAITNYHEED